MKVYATRKGSGVWLTADGYDSFEPCLMSKARAEQLASHVGGTVEVYKATRVFEYSIEQVVLPKLKLEEK